jgi:hypothetical protein
MKLSRFQAFGLHLLGSLGVGVISAALVFLVWYRWPLAAASGVTQIFLILLMVDVIIGPVITLIIFNPAKKELRRDLAVVFLIQLAALFYGLFTVFVARPVYMVYCVDQFNLVYAYELDRAKLESAPDPQFRSLPVWKTDIIGARLPDDSKERNAILFSALQKGDDLPQLPRYYVPYSSLKPQVLAHLQPLEKLKAFNRDRTGEVDALIARYSSEGRAVGFVPVRGKAGNLAVIISRESGKVLEIKNLKSSP